ncbi:GPW/gp25 family protein [Persephonella sp.]
MEKDFLGTGWSFPVRINENGSFSLSNYEKDIKEAIIIILKTVKGERFNHPDFGCGIYEYIFSSINSSTVSLIKNEIEISLKKYEPRIDINSISVEQEDQNKIVVSIEYTVRTTNKKDNLVYPFYLGG